MEGTDSAPRSILLACCTHSSAIRCIPNQGQRRVSCAAAKFDAPPASTPSSFIIDGPYIGNGNLGAALSADHGLQFWLGANNMWST